MIPPLPECPVGRIIGSTHNVWQEVFFIYRDREEAGGEVRGGCNRGNHVKLLCYYSLYELHKGEMPFFVAKQTFFHLSLPRLEYPPPVRCWGSDVTAAPETLFLGSWAGGGGMQGWENKVGRECRPHLGENAAAPVWSCCFVPLQSAEIAQINLLFAWLGQYVCVLCACVYSPTFPPSF